MVEDFGEELASTEFDELLCLNTMHIGRVNMLTKRSESDLQNAMSTDFVEMLSTIESSSGFIEPWVEVSLRKVVNSELFQISQSLLFECYSAVC